MKSYKFKSNLFRAVVALIGAFACGAVSAQVATTKHNLGSTGTLAPAVNAGTAEVCVFCHTPHGSATGAAVPLWNKNLPSGPFTTYDSLNSASLEGEIVGVGSVSIACLSCHDGSQAMDSMLNEPGSGADNAFAQTIGAMTDLTNGIAMLGTDLSNDHPVGVQYGGGGQAAGGAEAAALADPDFKATENTVLNTTTVWWVDTEATPSQTREKTDMILYTRTDGAGGLQEPFVECASCHDPHTATPLFLRTSNDGSAVCLACHTK